MPRGSKLLYFFGSEAPSWCAKQMEEWITEQLVRKAESPKKNKTKEMRRPE